MQVDVLESIPAVALRTEVFRFAICRDDDEFLQELGLDETGSKEMKELLVSCGDGDSLEELCDAPFRPKRLIYRYGFDVSRFSDGSFPVFYCSRDAETAEAEARHWFVKFAGRPHGKRRAWYQCFMCRFDGDAKDLVPKRSEWTGLTHDTDYRFCNRLGREASREKLHGLVAPSVRRIEGANLPVFERAVISRPQIVAVSEFAVHPQPPSPRARPPHAGGSSL